ncbi:hypothetical protein [Salinibacter ruber]|uniref:hypothetical protein n=1 Tax=Salinibacter ruber TaxID=146919 RepID=UPI0020730F89|nr:hypothetical protein [Salinibacter ruber]
MDALLHALDQVESYNYVVILQPTSPLRTADDIDATVFRCHQNDGTACMTVTENPQAAVVDVHAWRKQSAGSCNGSERKGHTHAVRVNDLRAEWVSVRGWDRVAAKVWNFLHRGYSRSSNVA